MHYVASQVVYMVGDNTVAPIAEVASVVDIEVEVVRIVATAELTPRMYVVAIVAVDIPGLATVASCIPLST